MAKNISRKLFLQWGSGLTGSLVLNKFSRDGNNTAINDQRQVQKKNLILKTIPSSGENYQLLEWVPG